MHREQEIQAFHEAWSNYAPFRELSVEHQTKLVQLCEAGLYKAVCDEYLKTHAVLDWEKQTLIDAYSSRGANVLHNLDLKSMINTSWFADKPDEIDKSLAARTLKGYLYLHVLMPPGTPVSFSLLDFGMVDPEKITLLSGVQMNEGINKEYQDQIATRNAQVLQVRYSEMYKCPQCRARKTHETSNQVRSLDECNTVHLTCLNCKHRWQPNA